MKTLSILYYISLFLLVATFTQLNAQTTKAYVGTGYGTGVDIFDVDDLTLIGNIPDAGGYRMVLSSDGKKLYSTAGDYYIYISDTQADTLITYFDPSLGDIDTYELEGISISPDGSRVYVTDESEDNLFVLDTATDSIIARASLELDEAEDNIVSPDGLYLYVNDNDSVSKISTDNLTIVGKAYASNDGHGVTISNDGNKIYAQGRNDSISGVIVVNAATMTVDTVLDASGYHLETSHDGTRVFGVDEGRTLSIIDVAADTVLKEIVFSRYYFLGGLSESVDGKYILLAGSGGLVKVDGATYSVLDSVLGGGYKSVVINEAVTSRINNLSNLIPSDYILLQNYPNPFNPTTTIKFFIPEANYVTLIVYNQLGQEIETLISSRLVAGLYDYEWDASGYSSGVYYYQLETSSGFVQIKKSILLK